MRCNGCQCTREPQRGTPRISYSPIWSHRSEFSWDTYEVSCSQMRSFEVFGTPTKTNRHSWGPWSKPGPTAITIGAIWRLWAPWHPCTGGPLSPDAPVYKSPSYAYQRRYPKRKWMKPRDYHFKSSSDRFGVFFLVFEFF